MTQSFFSDQPKSHPPGATREGPGEHERAGGITEAIAASAGVALAIIGLAGRAPRVMDSIAVIVLGAAFLFERWTATSRVHAGTLPEERADRALAAESIAGWAGVVLGILSLLRVAPTVLVPIALMVFGAGLVLGLAMGSRTARLFVGLCTVALGILALLQFAPRTLTLIGMIGVGGILLLTGPMVMARMHLGAHHPTAT
jgi:hypothetical protein